MMSRWSGRGKSKMIGMNGPFRAAASFSRNDFRSVNRPSRRTHFRPASLKRRVRFVVQSQIREARHLESFDRCRLLDRSFVGAITNHKFSLFLVPSILRSHAERP